MISDAYEVAETWRIPSQMNKGSIGTTVRALIVSFRLVLELTPRVSFRPQPEPTPISCSSWRSGVRHLLATHLSVRHIDKASARYTESAQRSATFVSDCPNVLRLIRLLYIRAPLMFRDLYSLQVGAVPGA